MPQFDIPEGAEIDWGQISQLINSVGMAKERQQNEKLAALRWEGEQDYQTLIDSGVDAREAFRRTSRKIFAGDPAGLARSMSSMDESAPFNPRMVEVEGKKLLQVSPRQFHVLEDELVPKEIDIGGTPHTQIGKQFFPHKPQGEKPLSYRDQVSALKTIADLQRQASEVDPNSAAFSDLTNNAARISALLPQNRTGGIAPPESQSPTVQPASGDTVVRTKQEYDALPSRTAYVGPDGKRYRKP